MFFSGIYLALMSFGAAALAPARPSHSAIVEQGLRLASQQGRWTHVQQYGLSAGGRPLVAMRMGDTHARRPRLGPQRAVLMLGVTHGDEYLGIEDKLPVWIASAYERRPGLRRFFDNGGLFYAVPVVNPDGYERTSRLNNSMRDINREFLTHPMTATRRREVPEAALLLTWLEKDLEEQSAKLALVVDYHCCKGALLLPRGRSDNSDFAALSFAEMRVISLMRQHINRFYGHGSSRKVLGYEARGTAKDYFFNRHGALAFTFEGLSRDEGRNFAGHAAWWEEMLSGLSSPAPTNWAVSQASRQQRWR